MKDTIVCKEALVSYLKVYDLQDYQTEPPQRAASGKMGTESLPRSNVPHKTLSCISEFPIGRS